MDFYAQIIEKTADPTTLHGIAVYFEQRNQLHLAGKYFAKAGDNNKALIYLLQSNDSESIELAIQLV